MFHIVPGLTSYSEAKQVLTEHITRDEGDHFHGQIGELALRVAMDSTGKQIRQIDVQSSSSNQISLAVSFCTLVGQLLTPRVSTVVCSRPTGLDTARPPLP